MARRSSRSLPQPQTRLLLLRDRSRPRLLSGQLSNFLPYLSDVVCDPLLYEMYRDSVAYSPWKAAGPHERWRRRRWRGGLQIARRFVSEFFRPGQDAGADHRTLQLSEYTHRAEVDSQFLAVGENDQSSRYSNPYLSVSALYLSA